MISEYLGMHLKMESFPNIGVIWVKLFSICQVQEIFFLSKNKHILFLPFLEFAFVAQTLLNSGTLRPPIPIAVEDIEESVVCCKISRYF